MAKTLSKFNIDPIQEIKQKENDMNNLTRGTFSPKISNIGLLSVGSPIHTGTRYQSQHSEKVEDGRHSEEKLHFSLTKRVKISRNKEISPNLSRPLTQQNLRQHSFKKT